jgi:hypothetical protein
MTDLNVRGTTNRAGVLVFSVVDFVQHARTDTPTYGHATCLFNWLRARHESLRHDVNYMKLPRGNSAYPTPTMTLYKLQGLLRLLTDNGADDEAQADFVRPDFRRSFEAVMADAALMTTFAVPLTDAEAVLLALY